MKTAKEIHESYRNPKTLTITEIDSVKAMEEYAKQFKVKSDKWDALDSKIEDFYFDKDGNELDDTCDGLLDIGEAAAKAFGYF